MRLFSIFSLMFSDYQFHILNNFIILHYILMFNVMNCVLLQLYAARKITDMKTFHTAINVIDKDVPRTDRTLDYFR